MAEDKKIVNMWGKKKKKIKFLKFKFILGKLTHFFEMMYINLLCSLKFVSTKILKGVRKASALR